MTIAEPNSPATGAEPELGTDGFEQMTGDPTGALGGAAAADPSAAGAATALLDQPDGAGLLEPGNGDATATLLAGDAEGAEPTTSAPPGPLPIPRPIPIRPRLASGRYRSRPAGFQLELRVDVDGRRPLRKLSGDYFSTSGGSTSYFGSWTVDAVTVTSSATETVIVGTARTTWQTTFTAATVRIPRSTIFQPPAPATIRWSTPSGAQGAVYVCPWESSAFRAIELEQDRESGITPFVSYDTGSLSSGGPARTLSTAGSFAEAGVQMLDTGGTNVINTAANHVWNDASLHNAMQLHFSRWAERPQFKVWLLHARRYVRETVLGIMFDQSGLERQGCASFYHSISSGSAAHRRDQLYVNVHELGHCFNLFHSFHKEFMSPPLPNRPGSLSWMNYPRFYNPGGGAPSGEAAFWAAFPFQFDSLELAHLRHGFRNAVIMGGNPFGQGAALGTDPEYRDGTAGRELQISVSPPRPMLGTPVVLQINLRAEEGRSVHRREQLHPKYGFVQVAVSRPDGEVVIYRPPAQLCVVPDVTPAGRDEELPVSAYVGYDAVRGQLFTDTGTYRIRATYTAPDGNPVASNIVTMRVGAPRDATDEEVAELLLGDEAGMVLTLLGSDSDYLGSGTVAMESVLERYGEHPNAVYARLALGTNAARPFLRVQPDGATEVRVPDLARADQLLTPAIDASRGDEGLDDLTVYETMDFLARRHDEGNDTTAARALRRSAITLAHSKGAPTSVMQELED